MSPEQLAALHARAFTRPPPWSAAAFAATLADPACFVLTAPGALLAGRAAGGEAELLTLATDPAARRQGLARGLLVAFEAEAVQRGARTAFLEVAEDNGPARALYAACGWAPAGRRPGYYRRPDGAPVAALILRKALARAG
jgi:ribosomal-protein-alanine N-acetyltransferase